ncbi:MAG: GNAT family N-acetyltransferase [Muribaculaceae bacterium]|nr:GNAT family N-acetyltransferase [Muribaculaceae bacterium]
MIETERLILRTWRESDAESLFKYAQDPDIGPIAGWPPHTSVECSLEIIRTVFAAPETYAVVLKETGEPIGCCGIMVANSLHSDNMNSGEAEIGYWIGKPYWGQGLIPEAVGALLSRSFNELRLDAVWCGYYDGNNKSKRVCEKSGFKYHHTCTGIISPLGDERTEHFYKMTKEDYLTNIQSTKH